ncbi:hypothetical protein [Aeromonas rivipollensis]|uniref:hypothetical protein n=1 Tax=Aeromonas rivipollensis TaxID=948519 RepID=UPI0030CBB6BF
MFRILFTLFILVGAIMPAQVGSTFTNPILSDDADPWVVRHDDGFYYYTQTTGNDITLWRTRDIADLEHAERKVVWMPAQGAHGQPRTDGNPGVGASTAWLQKRAVHSPPGRKARLLPAAAPSPPERLFGGCRQQPDAGECHVAHQIHHITRRDLPVHISTSPRSNNCQHGGDMD